MESYHQFPKLVKPNFFNDRTAFVAPDNSLTPYGYIIYQGSRLEAISLYKFLPPNTKVKIVKIEANTIFVEEDIEKALDLPQI